MNSSIKRNREKHMISNLSAVLKDESTQKDRKENLKILKPMANYLIKNGFEESIDFCIKFKKCHFNLQTIKSNLKDMIQKIGQDELEITQRNYNKLNKADVNIIFTYYAHKYPLNVIETLSFILNIASGMNLYKELFQEIDKINIRTNSIDFNISDVDDSWEENFDDFDISNQNDCYN